MALVTRHRSLNRQKTLELLDSLSQNRDINSCSLYLPPQKNAREITELLRHVDIPANDTPSLVDIIAKSQTGAIVFGVAGSVHLLLPPFPVTELYNVRECVTARLVKMLRQEYTIGLVLVRLGAYAVGVSKGEKLISSKVGTGNIHARHRQGGSSAHRFERHRDKQIEYFFTRICQHAREHLEPQIKTMDYLVYGGARTTILELQKQCDFLGKLKAPLLPPLLDIREPRQAVLKDAVHRVWSTTVYEWYDEN